MRILLDESLPIELRDELPGHSVGSVQDLKPLIAGLRSALAALPPRTLVTIGA